MDVRAAVAIRSGKPLEVMTVQLGASRRRGWRSRRGASATFRVPPRRDTPRQPALRASKVAVLQKTRPVPLRVCGNWSPVQ